MWVLGSYLLRDILQSARTSIYGPLAAPDRRPALALPDRARGAHRGRPQRRLRPGLAGVVDARARVSELVRRLRRRRRRRTRSRPTRRPTTGGGLDAVGADGNGVASAASGRLPSSRDRTTRAAGGPRLGRVLARGAASRSATPQRTGLAGRVVRVDRGLLHGPDGRRAGARHARRRRARRDGGRPQAAPCTGDWCLVQQWPDGPVTVETVAAAPYPAGAGGRVAAARTGRCWPRTSTWSRSWWRCTRSRTSAGSSGCSRSPGRAAPHRVVVLTKADLVVDGDAIAEDVRARRARTSR